jgi:uncharacterized membrane protein YphA (DoxX/SURF4 family)
MLYQKIVRLFFAVVFLAGGVAHLVLGRTMPSSYAVFGDTALFGWLTNLWDSFVMPNISWLTILMALFEIVCGAGLLFARTRLIAVGGILVFLVFITVLGYGFPTDSVLDDLLKNRIITIVMALAFLPVLGHEIAVKRAAQR